VHDKTESIRDTPVCLTMPGKILETALLGRVLATDERPPRDEVLQPGKGQGRPGLPVDRKVNDELLRVASKLRIAANVAVGYDNIDVDTLHEAAWWHQTPACSTKRRRDFAWTLMMAVRRRLSEASNSPLRN